LATMSHDTWRFVANKKAIRNGAMMDNVGQAMCANGTMTPMLVCPGQHSIAMAVRLQRPQPVPIRVRRRIQVGPKSFDNACRNIHEWQPSHKVEGFSHDLRQPCEKGRFGVDSLAVGL
jgi:hypothetical protein